jgi:hypothetical protein
MPYLLSNERSVKPPLSVIEYLDLIALWLRTPVDGRTLRQLRKQCGHLHAATGYARWNKDFRQKLEFKQPTDDALRWIARRNDGFVNQVQVTLDYIFDTDEARLDARAFLHRHLVRRWHRNQPVQFYEGEWYDGPRTAPNLITDYLEDYSRITGETCCLHLEWRATGVDAVRAAGITRPRHLLTFDHRAFWQKRMLLYSIDDGRMGRLIRNRTEATRSHHITAKDAVRGAQTIEFCETAQHVVDWCSRDVKRVMTKLDPEPFLPSSPYMLSTNLNVPNSDTPDYDRPDTPDYTLSRPLPRLSSRRNSPPSPRRIPEYDESRATSERKNR